MKLELMGAVEKFDGLSERVVVLEKKAVESDDTIDLLAQEVEMLSAENEELRGNFLELGRDLDEQTDRGLMHNINFFGQKTVGEE